VRDPTITSRILAAIDRSDDPHLHIDILREADLEQSEAISELRRDVKLLQDAQRQRLTDTGVWKIVKGKLDEKTVDWMKWAVRGSLAGVGAALLAGITWVLKLAWKGLHTT
jgi:hypothetical protein